MIRVAVATAVALLLWQCGSKHEEPTDTTETATASNCPDAVTAFTENIQPHIKATSCDQSGCHSRATDSGKFALKADTSKAAGNRDRMLEAVKAKTGLDAGKLWTYLDGAHTGKGKLGDLNETKVGKWITAEKTCK